MALCGSRNVWRVTDGPDRNLRAAGAQAAVFKGNTADISRPALNPFAAGGGTLVPAA